MPATLRHLDQPASVRLVANVPEREGGRYQVIRLWVTEPGRVALDPYPFRSPEFKIELPARTLEDRAFGSAEEAASAFHAAPVRSSAVILADGGFF